MNIQVEKQTKLNNDITIDLMLDKTKKTAEHIYQKIRHLKSLNFFKIIFFFSKILLFEINFILFFTKKN